MPLKLIFKQRGGANMKSKRGKTKSPVAKHMEKFNRPQTHRDKTKYIRKSKHKGKGYSPYSVAA